MPRPRVRLDLTIGLIAIGILAAVLLALSTYLFQRLSQTISARLETSAGTPARLLRLGSLAPETLHDREALEALVGESVAAAMLVSSDGVVLDSLEPAWIGHSWKQFAGAPLLILPTSAEHPLVRTLREGSNTYLLRIDKIEPPPSGERSPPTYFSILKLNTARVQDELAALRTILIGGSAGALVLMTGALALAFRTLVTRRIEAAARAVERIRDGDYAVQLPAPRRDDEITLLQRGINDMAGRLRETIASMKSAFRDLEAARTYYQIVVENATEAIFVVQNAYCVFGNSRLSSILETPMETLRSYPIFDFIHPDDRPMIRDRYSRRMSGDPSVPDTYEFRCLTPAGKTVWVLINVVRIDWKGSPATLNYLQDITARKESEAALLKHQALLNTTGRMARVGGWELDLATRKLTWTDEVRRIHEVDDDYEPDVETAVAFYTPDSRRLIEAAVRDAIEHGTPYDLELEIRTARGRILPVRSMGQAQIKDGRVVRIFGAFQDITDIKRMESERRTLENQLLQAQKLESIGRLAGGVAHDFNNMLQSISGNAALALLEIPEGHPAHEFLTEICDSARRSRELTRQLLAFARQQAAQPRVLDLNDAVASSINLLRRLIGEHIELNWKPSAELWHVEIDPTQVDQILTNLCVNAADAIDGAGSITIETANVTLDNTYARTHAECAPGDYVMIAVSDTGHGIDRETLDHIFEPFFTTKELGKGTGLGLSTVFGIVKQNRGFINVYSEPEHGSTFKVYLPRSTREQTEPLASEEIPDAHGNETILLVEDEKQVLRLGQKILTRHGYRVIPAQSPRDAIEAARRRAGAIDLLITDVVMPGMNGRDLFAHLRESIPNLKCIFMSGYTADIISRHGILESDIEFMEKPFTIASLTRRVRAVLDRQQTVS